MSQALFVTFPASRICIKICCAKHSVFADQFTWKMGQSAPVTCATDGMKSTRTGIAGTCWFWVAVDRLAGVFGTGNICPTPIFRGLASAIRRWLPALSGDENCVRPLRKNLPWRASCRFLSLRWEGGLSMKEYAEQLKLCAWCWRCMRFRESSAARWDWPQRRCATDRRRF